MPDGEYKLAVQRNERAYYAKVRLEIDHDDTQREAVIKFAPESSPNNADWAIAARFGITYVLEALPIEQRGGLTVRILELHCYPVDTTAIVVVFVAAHALLRSLQWVPVRVPTFDADTSEFVFPSRLYGRAGQADNPGHPS